MAATPDFDRLLALAVGGLFVFYLLRCFLGAALLALGHLPGAVGSVSHRCAIAVTPRLVRRIAAALFGIVSAGAIVAPAHATGVPIPEAGTVHAGQLVFDRVVEMNSVERHRVQRPDIERPSVKQLQVVRGEDCLWSLAADQLGPRANDEDIDRQWKRWYHVNKRAIGDDPDVIRTGTVLRVPAVAK